MSGIGNRTDDGERSEGTRRFVMTLIVSTAMAALTVWTLSTAVLGPDRVGTRGQAAAGQHIRS